MPEEFEIPTERDQEIIDERRELRALAEEMRPRWLDYLALSTALFSVLAAAAALQAGDKANEALLLANRAVLVQTQAVDTWMQYQADSIKREQQTSLSTIMGQLGGSSQTQQAQQAAQKAAKLRLTQQTRLREEASKRDQEAASIVKESQETLGVHQRYALVVTLFQIAIGLSAIAALLRMAPMWWVSMLAGGWACFVLLSTFFARS